MGTNTDSFESGDIVPGDYQVQGQDLFVAIFQIPSGVLGTAYLNLFLDYFRTGANPPPTGSYGVLQFKWGN